MREVTHIRIHLSERLFPLSGKQFLSRIGQTIAPVVFASVLVACGKATTPEPASLPAPPPPLPENAQTLDFEALSKSKDAAADEAVADEIAEPEFWGVDPGQPVPIMWDDLMPEGAEEALAAEYEAFYQMLEERYRANSTSLMDAQSFEEIEEGSAQDYMPQLGTFETVQSLNGVKVRIPGYVVPFDFDKSRRHDSFLLVPYMGACIHSPPPPPNQIIFIEADPAVKIEDIWTPFWIEGVLSTERNENEVGDAAYTLRLENIELYH